MNGVDSFREIYGILSNTSTERTPNFLRTFSDQAYQSIFEKASETEQQQLALYKDNALSAARQIIALPSNAKEVGELRKTAIKNLLLIRHTQQLMALFNDFDESVNTTFFKNSIMQLDFATRLDCVAKALSAKNRLVCPFKRKKLVELLAELHPDQRKDAKDALIAMLERCPGRNYEGMLYGFMTLVEPIERGPFMQDLSRLLAMTDAGNWQQLGQDLSLTSQIRRALLVRHTCSLVSPHVHLNSGTLSAIMRNVKMRLNSPEMLTTIAPVTSRCTDATYIPLILQELCQQTEAERLSLVHYLIESLPAACDSNSVYEQLRQGAQLTVERRRQVLNVIRFLQNSPITRNFVLFHALHEPFMMANLEELFASMTLDRYTLEIARDELTNSPLEVLDRLYKLLIAEKKTALQVTFRGERAIDAGGPAQEFVALLVEAVCEKLMQSKHELLRPCMRTLKPHEKTALEQLGALLIFCLHSSAKYVIGKQIDPSLFTALCRLNKELIDSSDLQTLFSIYEEMYSIHEDDIAALKKMKAYLQQDGSSLEDIAETIKEALEPCFLLYKGMLSTPFAVDILDKMTPCELEEALQGVTAPQMVVKQLKIAARAEVQEWIESWVLALPDEKLSHFLRLLTGTPTLNKRMLNIEFFGENLKFSTCTQTLTLPVSASESKTNLLDFLEFALETKLTFTTK